MAIFSHIQSLWVLKAGVGSAVMSCPEYGARLGRMTSTAGQKLGALLLPLYVLAVLAGIVSGAAAGLVVSLASLFQFTADPGLWAGWGPAGSLFFPVVFGIPAGGVIALVPATGAATGLFIQAWNVPFPSIKDQSLVAGIGAGAAGAMLATAMLLRGSTNPWPAIAVGVVFAAASFLIAWQLTARYLRHREAAL